MEQITTFDNGELEANFCDHNCKLASSEILKEWEFTSPVVTTATEEIIDNFRRAWAL